MAPFYVYILILDQQEYILSGISTLSMQTPELWGGREATGSETVHHKGGLESNAPWKDVINLVYFDSLHEVDYVSLRWL